MWPLASGGGGSSSSDSVLIRKTLTNNSFVCSDFRSRKRRQISNPKDTNSPQLESSDLIELEPKQQVAGDRAITIETSSSDLLNGSLKRGNSIGVEEREVETGAKDTIYDTNWTSLDTNSYSEITNNNATHARRREQAYHLNSYLENNSINQDGSNHSNNNNNNNNASNSTSTSDILLNQSEASATNIEAKLQQHGGIGSISGANETGGAGSAEVGGASGSGLGGGGGGGTGSESLQQGQFGGQLR